jgi:hypothetical protein
MSQRGRWSAGGWAAWAGLVVLVAASLTAAFPTGAPSCDGVPAHDTRGGARVAQGWGSGGFTLAVLDAVGARVETYVPGETYTGALPPLRLRARGRRARAGGANDARARARAQWLLTGAATGSRASSCPSRPRAGHPWGSSQRPQIWRTARDPWFAGRPTRPRSRTRRPRRRLCASLRRGRRLTTRRRLVKPWCD